MFASGICYTVVHMTEGLLPAQFPNTIGHESVGEIVDLGDAVTSRKIGDKVGVPWTLNLVPIVTSVTHTAFGIFAIGRTIDINIYSHGKKNLRVYCSIINLGRSFENKTKS